MKLEGSFVIPVSRDRVWSTLNDVGVMASCVPGCENVERLSDTAYKAAVKTEIGVIRARFNLVIEITQQEPVRRMCFTSRGEEGSRASILSSQNVVELEELGPQETKVTLTSDVSVTGRLGKFGLGVMKKKTESLTREFADSLRDVLLARPGAPATPVPDAR